VFTPNSDILQSYGQNFSGRVVHVLLEARLVRESSCRPPAGTRAYSPLL
jgi:hypothetical protein